MIRIDRAVRSAGWIRRMLTYTCIIENNHLYLIATGPAGRIHNAYNMPKDMPLFPPDLDEVERQITPKNFESCSKDKYCLIIPVSDIHRARLTIKSFARLEKGNYGEYIVPVLRLRTTQGRLYLEFRVHPPHRIEEFIEALKANNPEIEIIAKKPR